MRLDVLLVSQQKVLSRQKAQDLIKAERVLVNGKIANKASAQVTETDEISILRTEEEFVSRAGLKLAYALREFNISLQDATVVDIGSSTGGFTDCCLKNGAGYVYAVDVGTDQLVSFLRSHPQVCVMENTNARYLNAETFDRPIDFICMDVSFISVKLLLPVIASLLPSGKEGVILVKPQFEVGPRYLNAHGIVTDKKQRERIFLEISTLLSAYGLVKLNSSVSPIEGRGGNIEYLLHFRKR